MKYFVSVLFFSVFVADVFAASVGGSRPAMSNRIMSAPLRYTASINQLNGLSSATNGNETLTTIGTEPPMAVATEGTVKKDMREAERNACINNNIGVGNTFVWASRYSDTSNYASMVEDITNPENNVCFVRVELTSSDESRISVSDIKPKYFMWGEEVECGGWADKSVIEKRILEAKKGNRIAGIVASTIGGAGIGVGAMELFGNRLIGGKVEGQKNKNLDEVAVYRSQLLTLNEKGQTQQYKQYVTNLKTIKNACDSNNNQVDGFDCGKYASLLEEFGK